jgi:hypothetical protein
MTTPWRRPGHDARLERAHLSLKGLSVGDAFGVRFFTPPGCERIVPPPVWQYSDDTMMAHAVVEHLDRHRWIDRDELASSFARCYQADPYRGYGLTVPLVSRIDPFLHRDVCLVRGWYA